MRTSLVSLGTPNKMRAWTLLLTLSVVLMVFGPMRLGAESATPVPVSTGVVREVLMSGDPEAAPGQVLELVRYTIPANTQLPPHTHPGMQVALIESGTLHFTVLRGEVSLSRAGGAPGVVVAVTADSGEVAIHPRDAFVEPQGVVHFGRNSGPEPVVILVASLFAIDQPPALIVTPEAPPAT